MSSNMNVRKHKLTTTVSIRLLSLELSKISLVVFIFSWAFAKIFLKLFSDLFWYKFELLWFWFLYVGWIAVWLVGRAAAEVWMIGWTFWLVFDRLERRDRCFYFTGDSWHWVVGGKEDGVGRCWRWNWYWLSWRSVYVWLESSFRCECVGCWFWFVYQWGWSFRLLLESWRFGFVYNWV